MKKKLFKIIIPFLIVTSIFVGCNKAVVEPTPTAEITASQSATPAVANSAFIKDYIKFYPNTLYKYTSPDSELGDQLTFNDFVDEETKTYQRRTIIAGDTIAETFSLEGGKLVNKNGYSEFFGIVDMRDKPPVFGDEYARTVLQEPLSKGNTWDLGYHLNDTKITAEVTSDNVKVTTPLGEFDAIEVTSTFHDPIVNESSNALSKIIDYYVKDIGVVKSVREILFFDIDEPVLITYELSEVLEDVDFRMNDRFYYPITSDDEYKTSFEVRKHSFKTNDDIKQYFEKEFLNYEKNGNSKNFIDSGTKVNKINYDYDKGIIEVDFSANLLASMTDSETEDAILQSIVNTFGFYYRIAKVAITIDGSPYASDFMTMEAGETLSVLAQETEAEAAQEVIDDN